MPDIETWNSRAMHPLQSWEWGEFRRENGNLVSRISGDYQYQVVWSKIPFSKYYFGTLLKSHIPTAADLELLRIESRRVGGIAIRMEPNCLVGTAIPNGLVQGRHFFTKKTFYLDLTKTLDELLKAMHPKARYNIRLAEKKGVVIKEDNSEAAFKNYLDLTFIQTAERQKFYAHSRQYHMNMWKHLHASGIAHLFTATYEKQVLVTWIIFKFQDKIYFPYGASSSEHRDAQAPSLMLWETAKWGKAHEARVYDLWGAEEGRGFNRFKEQFGPELIEFVGTFDLVVHPLLYKLFRLSENIRWKILRLLK